MFGVRASNFAGDTSAFASVRMSASEFKASILNENVTFVLSLKVCNVDQSVEWFFVDTAAREGGCQNFPLRFRRSLY